MRETDLYPPLKAYLTAQGYEVKGEIESCDVTAVRGDEAPLVIELKLNLNISLLFQATDRLALTPHVYIGVPLSCPMLTKKRKAVIKLLRMLGLGLISIDPLDQSGSSAGATAVLLDPAPYQPRAAPARSARLLGEFHKRVGDPAAGGSDRRKGLMTAYRQRALRIASYLRENGTCKASVVARDLAEPRARDILYSDVYGWFDRHGGGMYAMSPRGEQEVPGWLEQPADIGTAA